MLGTMNDTRSMRDGPNGQPIENRVASAGEQVDISETKDGFSHIKLVNVPGQPDGWVSSDAINTGAAASGGPIDKGIFAKECWRDCIEIANPHYVAAVAELRSQVRDDSDNGNIGPFRLTQNEWDTNRKVADLFEFESNQVGNWRFQCSVFAVMVRGALTDLTTQLGKAPTAAQLYLGQIAGAPSAAKIVNSPVDNIGAALGSSAADLLKRYGALLGDSSGAAVTGDVALGNITKALGDALDTMRPFVLAAGNDLLDDTTSRTDVLQGANDSPSSQTTGATSGTFQQVAPTIMKKLIADFGFTKEQAAGVLGNLGEESGGFKEIQEKNPVGGGKGGLGWAQWTGSRRTLFENFLAQNGGLKPDSFDGNYGFLHQELTTTFKSAVTAVKGTATVEAAVQAFEATFEKANPKFVHFDVRNKFAQIALAAFG